METLRLILSVGIVLITSSLFFTNDIAAQAICSAPHSSPTLVQSGSINTLPPGSGWLQISFYRQRSDEFYNHLTDRQPFLADGSFDTRSLFVTGAFGIMRGLELWAQLPVHFLSAEAAGENNRSSGVGDIRVAARVGTELLGLSFPLALRIGVKAPGNEFPVDATVLPLTEGQVDFETSLESGSVLGSLPLYLVGWVGYRVRAENQDVARKPGNERFAHLAVGGLHKSLMAEIAVDGLWGESPKALGVILGAERRRLIQLIPTIGYQLGRSRLEFSTMIPIEGRNLPRGIGLNLGYRFFWGS